MEKMRLDSSSASFFQQEWSYSVGYEELMKFCLKFQNFDLYDAEMIDFDPKSPQKPQDLGKF